MAFNSDWDDDWNTHWGQRSPDGPTPGGNQEFWSRQMWERERRQGLPDDPEAMPPVPPRQTQFHNPITGERFANPIRTPPQWVLEEMREKARKSIKHKTFVNSWGESPKMEPGSRPGTYVTPPGYYAWQNKYRRFMAGGDGEGSPGEPMPVGGGGRRGRPAETLGERWRRSQSKSTTPRRRSQGKSTTPTSQDGGGELTRQDDYEQNMQRLRDSQPWRFDEDGSWSTRRDKFHAIGDHLREKYDQNGNNNSKNMTKGPQMSSPIRPPSSPEEWNRRKEAETRRINRMVFDFTPEEKRKLQQHQRAFNVRNPWSQDRSGPINMMMHHPSRDQYWSQGGYLGMLERLLGRDFGSGHWTGEGGEEISAPPRAGGGTPGSPLWIQNPRGHPLPLKGGGNRGSRGGQGRAKRRDRAIRPPRHRRGGGPGQGGSDIVGFRGATHGEPWRGGGNNRRSRVLGGGTPFRADAGGGYQKPGINQGSPSQRNQTGSGGFDVNDVLNMVGGDTFNVDDWLSILSGYG